MDYANTAEAAFQDAGGRWMNWSSFIRKLLNTFLCASQISSNVRKILFLYEYHVTLKLQLEIDKNLMLKFLK